VTIIPTVFFDFLEIFPYFVSIFFPSHFLGGSLGKMSPKVGKYMDWGIPTYFSAW
jgi:hypothetical protein